MNQNSDPIRNNENQAAGDELSSYEMPESWKPREKVPKRVLDLTASLEEKNEQMNTASGTESSVSPEEPLTTSAKPETTSPDEPEIPLAESEDTTEYENTLPESEAAIVASEEAPDRAQRKIAAWFSRLRQKPWAYLSISFFLPVALMYLLYVVKGIHPFGNESVLVLDLNGQYVYFYEALRNAIYGDKSLLYSFSRALGGEFLGIYAYYIASPFSYIVALFPQSRILEALLTIFLLKTGCSGLTFGWYLHKTTAKPNKYAVWIFSCLYALCSYAIVQQHNSMWIDAFIWLPVLTYLIEQMLKYGKFKLFIPVLALTLMSNFYIGYMVCIYIALYFFYYYLAHGGENGDINPRGEKIHFLRSLLRMGFSALLAIGIAAVILLAAYYSLTFGKNTFSTPNWSFILRYDLADLFVKLLPGTYDTVRPAGLPFIYCGILTLLMIPFYFLSKNISVREKLFSVFFVAVFVLSFIISPVDIVWHGFQKPNWLNYRYSFLLSFFLLTLAYKATAEFRKQKAHILFLVGSALAVIVMILQKFKFPNFVLDGEYGFVEGRIDPLRTVLFSLVMIVLLCAVLYLLLRANEPKARQNLSRILLIVVCVELFGNGIIHMTSLDCDVVYSSYSSYNEYISRVRPIVNEVMKNDPSFYRMEKTTHRKTNDNMALGMRGLSCSTSTLNKETIHFLSDMGYASESHWSRYLGGNPLSDSLLGLKYILCDKNISETRAVYHESMALEEALRMLGEVSTETANYTAYKNPYALSIAYAVDEALNDYHFRRTNEDGKSEVLLNSPFERLNSLVTAMTGSKEPIQVFVPIEIASTYTNGQKSTIAGHTSYKPHEDTGSYDTYALFTISMPEDALLYFYAPSLYPREVKLTVNNEEYEDFMASDSDRIKALGYRERGSNVTVKLILEESNLYLKNDEHYLYYFDIEAFEKVMNILADGQFAIEKASDSHLEGTIRTNKEKTTILTTIAYDEGWNVFVDGKKVPIRKSLDALVSFDIEGNGNHTLELKYSPKIVNVGALISLGSVILYGAILGGDLLIRRRRAAKNTSENHDQTKGQ